ncbi:hypothetical protein [Nannocystis sp. SCPEA4]|uniref:hypothetical protein n=1 Tax=Nannocystis sp. SCPEA4 TaxID=2996787 RepID=UPI002271902C|nr:hypothetical protein [Nannocystis sp. SCPEA4]MCY1059051.1 hypothetical protein [Nannocystis sp. SCPEA4]
MRTSALAGIALAVILCGCDEQLSDEDVSGLPAGDALGDAFAGDYTMELLTLSCEGLCLPVQVSELMVLHVCDVGARQSGTARVSQTDGRLQIDIDGALQASRLIGGVDGDGSFDVGGVTTAASRARTFRSRVQGTLDANGGTGSMHTSSTGRSNIPEQQCEARLELSLWR